MSAIDAAMPSLKRQVPAFAAVGAFGFVAYSALIYVFVRGLGMSNYVAPLPAFCITTVINFGLNRWLTFGSQTPILRAFVRYCLVCSVGLVLNWGAYVLALRAAQASGFPTPPEVLPIFAAFGTGVAMFATFFGFKWFAFRP